jgi:hypothetical protein
MMQCADVSSGPIALRETTLAERNPRKTNCGNHCCQKLPDCERFVGKQEIENLAR